MPVRRLTPEELYKQGLVQKEMQAQADQRYANSLKLNQQKVNASTTNASANMLNAKQAKELAALRANTSIETANIGVEGALATRELTNKNNIRLQGLMKEREHNAATYSLIKSALNSGRIKDLNSATDVYNSPDAYIPSDLIGPGLVKPHYKMVTQKDRVNLQGLPIGVQQPMGAFDTASGTFRPFNPDWNKAGLSTSPSETTQGTTTTPETPAVSPQVQQILDQVTNLSDSDLMRAKILRAKEISKAYPGISTEQLKALSGLQ